MRQTGGVRYIKKSELLEDVYTYNDFSCDGVNKGLANPDKVSERLVPYLVTEHNGHMFPTRIDDNEARKLEQALRHLYVIEDAFGTDRISGAIGWCFADYNTHDQFGASDRICYHGVMDMFRLPKYAAYTYMSQKQNQDPVLEVASSMAPGEGDRNVLPPIFVFTNCDYVKAYIDDYYLGKNYSEWELFPNIPNAPIIIDDFIGNRILENEPFSKKVATRIKDLIISYNKNGFSMPLKDKMKIIDLMLFHHFNMKKMVAIFGKYSGNDSTHTPVYRFEGYTDDKLVKTITMGAPKKAILKVYPDCTSLVHGDTYDVVRVVVRMEDEYSNTRPLARDVVSIETSEGLVAIGPDRVALLGGSIAFFLKTTGKTGKAKATFAASGFEPVDVEFEIR